MKFMRLALDEARQSKDDVPVGALLVSGDGRMMAKAHNLREQLSDPSAKCLFCERLLLTSALGNSMTALFM
jgi:tRNA(Arg) A34 adenosine deaminase TadA